MGETAFQKVQLGLETTPGTAVAATTILRENSCTLKDNAEVVFPDEDVSILPGTDRSYIPYYEGAMDVGEQILTFEQGPYPCEMGIKAVGTGAADGAGSGKVYGYPWPTTAANTIKTGTIEGGDNAGAERMEYCFFESLKISGGIKNALKWSGKMIGRQVQPNAFTGALSIPTVEDVMVNTGKVYLNAAATYPATTQVSNTIKGFELNIKTGWRADYTTDGNLYFSRIVFDKDLYEIMLNVTFVHNATAIAQKANRLTQAAQAIKLLFEGSALTTAGTTYSKKSFIANLLGKWESFSEIGKQDGNSIVTGTMRCRYNASAAAVGGLIFVNQLATLP
jgi:hypothetical protein